MRLWEHTTLRITVTSIAQNVSCRSGSEYGAFEVLAPDCVRDRLVAGEVYDAHMRVRRDDSGHIAEGTILELFEISAGDPFDTLCRWFRENVDAPATVVALKADQRW